jgi:hypothetical protein
MLYHLWYALPDSLSGKVYINETRQDTVSHGYLNLSGKVYIKDTTRQESCLVSFMVCFTRQI